MMYLKAISIVVFLQTIPPTNHHLDVRITNIKKGTGKMEVCVFRHADTFLKKGQFCETREVSGKEDMTFQFQNIQSGPFAVSVTQDVNSNGQFDLGFLKIPKEPYGFSNNPSTTFGPPSFEEASINLNKDTTITIEL